VQPSDLEIASHIFQWGTRTYIMGILNLTPDSFSGDGLLIEGESSKESDFSSPRIDRIIDQALKQARQFVASGADMIDVGGESTRPGSEMVSPEVEMARVLPVIEAVVSQLDTIVSVDTYKAEVAQAALEAGAQIVNDVWGLHADPKLAEVVAQAKIPIILMHNRSSWAHAQIKDRLGGRYVGIPYENLLEDIKNELLESVSLALGAGISKKNIILDPGIGFGKTVEQNLELLDRLNEIKSLGYPVLVGPSRKSFIGYTLDQPPDQRLEGTAAAVSLAIARGADILRIHDVDFMVKVAKMTDAIVRRG
jgi:dihydropteroate synthase